MSIYTTREVAAALGISESQIQKYAAAAGVQKIGGRYAFTDNSVATVRRHMEARRVAHLETRLENINRPSPVPFDTPIAPSAYSEKRKPQHPHRPNGTLQKTVGDVSTALAGIEEARERAAAANHREAVRFGGAQ